MKRLVKMARQSQANEFNTFVGGFVTEASPLTFPQNTALDIDNFILNKDGSLRRRLGMDYEDNHILIDADTSLQANGEVSVSTHNWDNVGGNPALRIIVVQVGSKFKFFGTSGNSISSELLYTYNTQFFNENMEVSSAVVGGTLVMAFGSGNLVKFTYDEDSENITPEQFRLKTRDVFGVEAVYNSLDLREVENVGIRPATLSQAHTYNLRNSTYAIPRLNGNDDAGGLQDPISSFKDGFSSFPSNSDSVIAALFADAEDEDSRFAERFFPEVLKESPLGNLESPRGYFIIDVLNRGLSRLEQIVKLQSETFPEQSFDYPVTTLPQDRTTEGATVVSEFAGRMWYGGFSGSVIDGDRHSPSLSSYVFYSRLVESPSDLGACHQVGDPTSKESPDVVDTDGGFIPVDGAYGIKSMVNIGSALIIIAENGVWAITGGSDYGFTATDNKVVKITEHGCSNRNSVVLVDSTVMYWGDDGIYQVSYSEVGDLGATNITTATIQTFYDEIDTQDKRAVQGAYDTYERKARWLFGNRFTDEADTVELVLDLNLGAFYKNTIPGVSTGNPNVVAFVELPPFRVGEVTNNILFGDDQVVDDFDTVQDTSKALVNGLREVAYLTVTSTSPFFYTFSKYKDAEFIDWKTLDGVGIDSPAYLITGYEGGGDFQRYKQVPYLTMHFEKTEDGFFTDELGDIYPTNESSCIVQAQWEWANSPQSGRWGREFQGYRHKRFYIPEDASDTFDNGFSTVITKNKLRGKGKVLSLLMKTSPTKNCKLLGWSTIVSRATNV